MSPNQFEGATAESLPEHEIIDEFDEMLEIDDIDSESAGATSEIAQWLREFRLN